MNDTLNCKESFYPDIFRFEDLYQSLNQESIDSLSKSYNIVTEHRALEIEPKIRTENNVVPEWSLVLVLVSLFLIILFKQLYPRRFRMLFKAAYGINNLNQLLRENNPVKMVFGYIVFVLYLLNISLFFSFFVTNSNHSLGYSELELFLLTFTVLLSVYLFKMLSIFLLSWLFQTKNSTQRYLTLNFSIFLSSLMAMLLVLLVAMYNPFKIFYVIGFVVIVAFALFRLFKGCRDAMLTLHFSMIYIFLYFCTLEIIPSFILVKLCFNLFANN